MCRPHVVLGVQAWTAAMLAGVNVQTSCCSWCAGLDTSNASRVMDVLSGVNVQTSCCSWCAGLDSSNASRVVDILSGLASAGVTVIITIHQPRPDILRLMDRMLLLSGNGQVCPHP